MAELIIVTGGAHSGKTGVIETLASRGHEVLSEAAVEIIAELVDQSGIEAQAAWRRANVVAFQRLIFERQHARETEARRSAALFVFCDRGLLDGLAYSRFADADWPAELHARVDPTWYRHVFLLDTLASFDMRRGTGRIDTHADSLRVATIIESVYRAHDLPVSRVPEHPVDTRVDLILATLGLDPA